MHAHHARRRPSGFVSSGLLALALLAPAAGHADCHVKVAELPVHMVGLRAMATVGINDQDVPLMVDTGASFSFLNEAAAAQLKLATHRAPNLVVRGLTGRVSARLATVERLKLSRGTLPDVDFIVGGNEMGSGAMGVIGRDLLNLGDTEYDLAHGMIRFVFPNDDCAKANMAYWAADPAGVMSVDLLHDFDRPFGRQALRATAKLNGKDIDVVFDSGATTIVSLDAANRVGVKEAAMTPNGLMHGAGKGAARQWTGPFDRFELGGEQIDHNRLQVGEFEMDDGEMLLGVDFFLSHHLYVSTQQKKMYFTYDGGPVFVLNKAADAATAPSAAADTLDADGLLRRGAASRARRDLAGALADLDRACALAPANAACFATRAGVHADLKQPEAALADLDTALRLDPALAGARLERAWMRRDDDPPEATLADLAELDRTLPPQSQIRSSMADLYAELQMPAQVVVQLDHWIPFHPHDIALAGAYDERCRSRVRLGVALDKALDDCDAAVDLDGKAAAYLDSRGWVRLRMGQWARAKSDFDKALARRPGLTASLYGRGIAQARLGDAAASQADLAAARRLRPTIAEDMRPLGLAAEPPGERQ